MLNLDPDAAASTAAAFTFSAIRSTALAIGDDRAAKIDRIGQDVDDPAADRLHLKIYQLDIPFKSYKTVQ